MKNYVEFYEKQDRENIYAAGLEAENHQFFSVLNNIKKYLKENNITKLKVLEIGAGNGRFQDVFDNYTAIDITENSRKFFHKKYVVIEDEKPYPFKDDEFNLVFTNAVFEHIPNINLALKEMIRITKQGGYIVFNPAWQCRPWAADGYPVRPYSDFSFFGKIYKATIPIRENLLFRLSYIIPRRLFFLILFLLSKEFFKNKLIYKKIKANYEVYWMSDSDACNNIDPFMAILYFKANNLEIVNYSTLLKQFLIRTNEIILRKKG